MIWAHQAIFDRDLAGSQVDQPAVDEVRTDAPRAFLGQHQGFTFNARKATNARADRHAGTLLKVVVHLGQPGIFERLAGRVDGVDGEGIDLTLDLVIDTLVGIEAVGWSFGFTSPAILAFWSLVSN